MSFQAVLDLFIAFFTCIGILFSAYYLMKSSCRRYAAKHDIFTIVKIGQGGDDDFFSVKHALWYADKFTSDEVFLLIDRDGQDEELKRFCDSLYVTKIAGTGEVCCRVCR